jgi:fluoride exporter
MTAGVLALLTCLAGGVGAALRLVLDGLIRDRVRSTYPVATTIINITGSLLLGLLTGLASQQLLPHQWQLITGTGLLGGYTTFSTASFETLGLLEDRRYAAAALNAFGLLITGTGAAAVGLITGLAL